MSSQASCTPAAREAGKLNIWLIFSSFSLPHKVRDLLNMEGHPKVLGGHKEREMSVRVDGTSLPGMNLEIW